ncbi:RHS repeat-associated core domain-containing protein [Yersinia aldovae]|nr:RHS repeat-associated core domain-containing protein [Yersinia aldovae]
MYTVVLIYSLADAFGRRIRKLRLVSNAPAISTQGDEPTASEKTGQVGYEYLWSGDQLIEEVPIYADGTAAYDQSIHWLYAPGALTPAARYENGKLHYVVADHLGTPRELLNEQGKVVWANRLSTWGRAELWRQAANDEDNVTCNLRFAGQYADAESGLHYNRFRYYDGETGQYLCPDPIGLLGGNNPYGYVHNPLGWVDPYGLAACPIAKLKEKGFTGVEPTKNGGLDYSASNALYSKNGVNPIQKIEYTGDYHKDFEQASMAALGQKSTPKGYVWHHLDDYNSATNTGTMQLVQQKAHSGIPHVGGVSQYKAHTGISYIFKTW